MLRTPWDHVTSMLRNHSFNQSTIMYAIDRYRKNIYVCIYIYIYIYNTLGVCCTSWGLLNLSGETRFRRTAFSGFTVPQMPPQSTTGNHPSAPTVLAELPTEIMQERQRLLDWCSAARSWATRYGESLANTGFAETMKGMM